VTSSVALLEEAIRGKINVNDKIENENKEKLQNMEIEEIRRLLRRAGARGRADITHRM